MKLGLIFLDMLPGVDTLRPMNLRSSHQPERITSMAMPMAMPGPDARAVRIAAAVVA